MRGAARNALAGALLLAGSAHVETAAALTQAGSLGSAASDSDFYQATCSDDGNGPPASLVAQVLDAAPAVSPLVSIQLVKASPALATSATDAVDGDTDASPSVALDGAAGTYDVFVDKTAAGAESYVLTVQCMTGAGGGGVATGTALAPIATGASSVPATSIPGLLSLGMSLAALGAAALRRGRAAGILVLLAAIGIPANAWSHVQNGTLGSAASSTDFYQITCSDDDSGAPASLTFQILDTAPVVSALVSVQAQKGILAINSTDAVDGDATPSPLVWLNGGPGVFDVLVYKTASGNESYSLTFHCMTGPDGTGEHTGTSITTRQNQ